MRYEILRTYYNRRIGKFMIPFSGHLMLCYLRCVMICDSDAVYGIRRVVTAIKILRNGYFHVHTFKLMTTEIQIVLKKNKYWVLHYLSLFICIIILKVIVQYLNCFQRETTNTIINHSFNHAVLEVVLSHSSNRCITYYDSDQFGFSRYLHFEILLTLQHCFRQVKKLPQ